MKFKGCDTIFTGDFNAKKKEDENDKNVGFSWPVQVKSSNELKSFLPQKSVADKYLEESIMEADTTVNYRTLAETTDTPKLPAPLQRKPDSKRSVETKKKIHALTT